MSMLSLGKESYQTDKSPIYSLKRLKFPPLKSVMNPVYELLFIHHKMSLIHHIDSHTAQTVTLTLDFSSHNPLHSFDTLLQPITYLT